MDVEPPQVKKDPLAVSLQDKVSLLSEYVELIWSVPHITTSALGYGDSRRKRVLATSDGTYIEQEKIDVTMRMSATARDGADVQQSSLSLGSSGDYSFVEHLHEEAEMIAHRAVDLLKAPQGQRG